MVFPTKNHPMFPKQEPGFIRFTKDLPPPIYKLGLERTSNSSEERVETFREKVKLHKNRISKERNLND